jgi:hypothetical protein
MLAALCHRNDLQCYLTEVELLTMALIPALFFAERCMRQLVIIPTPNSGSMMERTPKLNKCLPVYLERGSRVV